MVKIQSQLLLMRAILISFATGNDYRLSDDYRHDSYGNWYWQGSEQNAPLGRAVIGGLMFATFATLFFVPAVFSIIHGKQTKTSDFSAEV